MPDRTVEFGTIGPTNPPGSRVETTLDRLDGKHWNSVWWPDHFMGLYPQSVWTESDAGALVNRQQSPHTFFETMTSLGYAAAVTDDVRLGTHVTEALRRHPIMLAQASLTLHHLSGGRMILGLGAGEKENLEPYGIDFSRQVSKFEEALDIVRLAWESPIGTTFDYDGQFWQLRDAVFDLPPLEEHDPAYPPIWIGAHGPRMLSLAGKHADGWLPTAIPPSRYEESWQRIVESARNVGRDPADITRGLSLSVIVDETRDDCRELLDSLLVRLECLTLPADRYRAHGFAHPLGDDFAGIVEYVPSRIDRERALEAANSVPMEVITDHYVWGAPEDIAQQLEAYVESGVEHFVFLNQTHLADHALVGRSFQLLERACREVAD